MHYSGSILTRRQRLDPAGKFSWNEFQNSLDPTHKRSRFMGFNPCFQTLTIPPLMTKKSSLATLASVSAASSASATIIGGGILSVAGGPALPLDTAAWDIDGNTVDETTFRASGMDFGTFGSANLRTNNPVLNFGFLLSGTVLKPVSNYGVVDSSGTFGTGLNRQFFFSSFGTNNVSNLLTSSTPSPTTIGFRFDRDGSTHYGVAELNYTFSTSSLNTSLSLENVRWNDVAGEQITGGSEAVPEPSEAAMGLGLLALGAAGLRRMRHSKQK